MSKYHIVVNHMSRLKYLLSDACKSNSCTLTTQTSINNLDLSDACKANQLHALKLLRCQFLNLLIFQMLASQIHALQLLRCASIIQEGKFPTIAVSVQIWLHSTMSLRNVTSCSVMKPTVKTVALVLLHRVQSSNAGL